MMRRFIDKFDEEAEREGLAINKMNKHTRDPRKLYKSYRPLRLFNYFDCFRIEIMSDGQYKKSLKNKY